MGYYANNYSVLFLMESILPGIKKALVNGDINSIVNIVVDKAHRDVMVGARYKINQSSIYYCNNNVYYRDILRTMILNCKRSLSGRNLIIRMVESNNFNINIGLIQKLVNMSIKYLYVMDSCDLLDFPDYEFQINTTDCDCPLDSIILGKLHEETGVKYNAWTKISDYNDYIGIQNDIEKLGYTFRLNYDLINWRT